MPFTPVALTGVVVDPTTGRPIKGSTVSLLLSHAISDGATIVEPSMILVRCADADGCFSVTVPANDDATTAPVGTFYTVAIRAPNSPSDTFRVIVPKAYAPEVPLLSLPRLSGGLRPEASHIAVSGQKDVESSLSVTTTSATGGVPAAKPSRAVAGPASSSESGVGSDADLAGTPGPRHVGSSAAAGPPVTAGTEGSRGATAPSATFAGGSPCEVVNDPAGSVAPPRPAVSEDSEASEPHAVMSAGRGGVTGLLGVAQVGGTYSVYRCSSESLVPVDATNLTVLFTAPTSGRVLVRLNAWTAVPSNYPLIFGVLDHATGQLHGDPGLVNGGSATGSTYVSFAVLITGLIPSASYHFDWGYAVQGTHGSETGIIEIGLNNGPPIWCYGAPAVMEVWSA